MSTPARTPTIWLCELDMTECYAHKLVDLWYATVAIVIGACNDDADDKDVHKDKCAGRVSVNPVGWYLQEVGFSPTKAGRHLFVSVGQQRLAARMTYGILDQATDERDMPDLKTWDELFMDVTDATTPCRRLRTRQKPPLFGHFECSVPEVAASFDAVRGVLFRDPDFSLDPLRLAVVGKITFKWLEGARCWTLMRWDMLPGHAGDARVPLLRHVLARPDDFAHRWHTRTDPHLYAAHFVERFQIPQPS